MDLRLKISDVQIHTPDAWQGPSGMRRFCLLIHLSNEKSSMIPKRSKVTSSRRER